jgi:hypothetical protein
MAGAEAVFREHLESFQRDIARPDLPIRSVVRRHVITGDPVAITRDQYFDLRDQVGKEFNIHPTNIILVGSCRTGFTLKKGERGRYRLCRPDSDLDIAVVSPELFNKLWDAAFSLAEADRMWRVEQKTRWLIRDMFEGKVRPHTLPRRDEFKLANDWKSFFDTVSRERAFGTGRKVSGFVYSSWHRLEAYQERLVQMCRDELLAGGS